MKQKQMFFWNSLAFSMIQWILAIWLVLGFCNKSHLLKNSPLFVVIHTVKGFGVVNKAEVFLELLAFLMIQWMLAIWFLVPLAFLNPAWMSGSSQFIYCWRLAWRISRITWTVCEMSAIVQWFEHSLVLPFFGIGIKTDLFQSCGHCWVFQICWHIECSI